MKLEALAYNHGKDFVCEVPLIIASIAGSLGLVITYSEWGFYVYFALWIFTLWLCYARYNDVV